MFFEDKNEEDEQRNCAVYSHLTNTMLPQPCDAKHEWICQVARGQPLFQATTLKAQERSHGLHSKWLIFAS